MAAEFLMRNVTVIGFANVLPKVTAIENDAIRGILVT